MANKLKNSFSLSVFLWLIVLLINPIDVFPQAKYSNEFLTLGVGARGLGLANTQVAVCNDVTAGYWNPAGLANVEQKYQLSLMHAEYFAGIAKYDYAAFSYRIDEQRTVGATVIRFGVDDIPNTTQLIDKEGNVRYDLITTFSAADWGILLSYAQAFEQVKGLSFGGNFKIIRRKIGDFAGAWGFGLDAGLQYEVKKWKMGLVLKDVTSTFNMWSHNLSEEMKEVFIATDNELPENGLEYTLPRLLIGAGREFELKKGFSLMSTLDLDMSFDGRRNELISSKAVNVSPHLGLEFGYKNMVFLRTGIGNFQKEQKIALKKNKDVLTCQINAGVGICIKDIVTIDYAYSNLGSVSAAVYSHIFSLKLALNGLKK
ncbi:MAG: PorV/PorQ family protein [Lentimicrobiaceae bacterium]|nr:PorV/PorQ family protein [Lentimicrobiaceae bacterium]